jgi:hypothetical protein
VEVRGVERLHHLSAAACGDVLRERALGEPDECEVRCVECVHAVEHRLSTQPITDGVEHVIDSGKGDGEQRRLAEVSGVGQRSPVGADTLGDFACGRRSARPDENIVPCADPPTGYRFGHSAGAENADPRWCGIR